MIPGGSAIDRAARPERRTDSARRARIEQALGIVRPFFEAEGQWAGHSLDHMAYRRLREEMPELAEADVHLLVVVASRIFAPRRG
ncbi:MAG: hypothetical protein KDH15_01890 [Rhodocyclaceae bacterium]|nr:hypothetical protein [Rhodocyclaceae bacterium]